MTGGVTFSGGSAGTVLSPFGFSTPALMNGSTTVAQMQGVAVNSSKTFAAVGINSNTFIPVAAYSSN